MNAGWEDAGWDAQPSPDWSEEIGGAITEASLPGELPDHDETAPKAVSFPDQEEDPFGDISTSDAVEEIGAAIADAVSELPQEPEVSEGAVVAPDQEVQAGPSDNVEVPCYDDLILLELVGISTICVCEDGEVCIEPDAAGLQRWSPGDRATAEHLVAWLNGTGNGYRAIETAIMCGERQLIRMMAEYEDILVSVGYDRTDPAVQEQADLITCFHNAIEQTKVVLRSY